MKQLLLALTFGLVIGTILGWFLFSSNGSTEPLPDRTGMSVNSFNKVFHTPKLPPVVDRRFYTIDKVETRVDTVEVPVKMYEEPFRLLYDNSITITNDEVRLRTWNPNFSRYEADVFRVPEKKWSTSLSGSVFRSWSGGLNAGIGGNIDFEIRYRKVAGFVNARYDSYYKESILTGIRFYF